MFSLKTVINKPYHGNNGHRGGGGGGGGVGYFVYTGKLCRYVCPQMVWALSHFGLKWGLDFNHYGLLV